jgi:hypothetical protein
MPNQQEIHKHQAETKSRIVKAFSTDSEKSISPDDFSKSYPSDKFNFFSEKAIESFKSDFAKSEDADSNILNQTLGNLEKVRVQTGENQCTTFYVSEVENAE